MPSRMSIVEGDITRLDVDVIVNAANQSLKGGGGVDGAIHRAAGPRLLAECRRLGGCPTGAVRITGGHDLAARFVIHAVGPVWRGGGGAEEELLARCYSGALELAASRRLATIAFPAISTGVYRFPPERAAAVAVDAVATFLATDEALRRVIFCCFGKASVAAHEKAVAEMKAD